MQFGVKQAGVPIPPRRLGGRAVREVVLDDLEVGECKSYPASLDRKIETEMIRVKRFAAKNGEGVVPEFTTRRIGPMGERIVTIWRVK
jgi:hypothetical protein